MSSKSGLDDDFDDDSGTGSGTDTGSGTGSGTETGIGTGSGSDDGQGRGKPYKFSGTDQDDLFAGLSANDKVNGGAGNDTLSGGSGNDKIFGGDGDDRLVGDAGVDKLSGGSGMDTFVFNYAANGNADRISDFSVAEGDLLAFDTTVFSALLAGISLENIVIADKAVASDENDFLLFSRKGGKLYYDADGNGAGKAILLAGIRGDLDGLDADHFVVA